jgi:hypothetical protein
MGIRIFCPRTNERDNKRRNRFINSPLAAVSVCDTGWVQKKWIVGIHPGFACIVPWLFPNLKILFHKFHLPE